MFTAAETLPDLPEVRLEAALLARLGLLKAAERAVKDVGPALRLILPDGRAILLLASAAHAAFWAEHSVSFCKDVARSDTGAGMTRAVLGDTLLTAPEGDIWRRQRDQLTGLLAQSRGWFQRPLAAATADLISGLMADKDNLLDLCIAWAMRAICDPILGNARLDRAAHDLVLALNDGFVALIEGQSQASDLQSRFTDFLHRVQATRGGASIAALVEKAAPDDIDALRSVVGGMLAGSLHINALSLFWALVQLADHPGLQTQIAAEADKIGNGARRVVDTPLAFATLRETQRLRPTMAFVERQVAEHCQFGNLHLHPGETVLFSPWFAHRDPEAWDDPLRFDPSRFLPGARQAKGAYLPFGLGPRQCPGANLVNQQLTYAISELCRAGRLQIAADQRPGDLGCLFRVNLEPRGPVRLNLTPHPTPLNPQLTETSHAV